MTKKNILNSTGCSHTIVMYIRYQMVQNKKTFFNESLLWQAKWPHHIITMHGGYHNPF